MEKGGRGELAEEHTRQGTVGTLGRSKPNHFAMRGRAAAAGQRGGEGPSAPEDVKEIRGLIGSVGLRRCPLCPNLHQGCQSRREKPQAADQVLVNLLQGHESSQGQKMHVKSPKDACSPFPFPRSPSTAAEQSNPTAAQVLSPSQRKATA